MTRQRRFVAALALLAVLGAACSSGASGDDTATSASAAPGQPAAFDFTGVAARVEGTEISAERLGELVELASTNESARQVMLGDRSPIEVEGSSQPRPSVVAVILDQEITNTLIDQEVAKRALVVSDSDRELAKIQAGGNLGPLAADLPEDFVQLFVDRYAASIALDKALTPEISEAELRAKYDENPASYEHTCVRHILLTDRELAASTKAELEGGADFATLAGERSKDPGSAIEGGDLGCVPRGVFVAAFEKAAWEGPVGEIQGPVESEFGLHLIQVTKRGPLTFDEAREDIEAQLAPKPFDPLRQFLVIRRVRAAIEVDGRFGIWDRTLGRLNPLGQAGSGLSLVPADGSGSGPGTSGAGGAGTGPTTSGG